MLNTWQSAEGIQDITVTGTEEMRAWVNVQNVLLILNAEGWRGEG